MPANKSIWWTTKHALEKKFCDRLLGNIPLFSHSP